jgi:hypothetical protein
MNDFCKFTDGHKEEIIHWKQWDTKPMVITFLTPTGIYKFEQDVIENYDIKGNNNRITKPATHQFYKYDGREMDYEICFGTGFSTMMRAKWEYIYNIESINFTYPEYRRTTDELKY